MNKLPFKSNKIHGLAFNFKIFCIPEGFITNISHQLFDYTTTFVKSQHKNNDSNDDFVLKRF